MPPAPSGGRLGVSAGILALRHNRQSDASRFQFLTTWILKSCHRGRFARNGERRTIRNRAGGSMAKVLIGYFRSVAHFLVASDLMALDFICSRMSCNCDMVNTVAANTVSLSSAME